jgi:hypothetical protein
MPRYDAYLLRIWRTDSADRGRWAGRLEHLPDGEYRRFDSLEELLLGLRQLLADESGDLPGACAPAATEMAAQE